MSEIRISIGTVGDDPEVQRMERAYHAELTRRNMPSTWPKTLLMHQASLFWGDSPLTMVMFAPIQVEPECMDENNVYISGAYTMPSWRRLGLYSDLLELMIERWRLQGTYDWLKSGFHLDNETSRAMQVRQGREFYQVRNNYQRTRLSLRPTGAEQPLTKMSLEPILSKLERLTT